MFISLSLPGIKSIPIVERDYSLILYDFLLKYIDDFANLKRN